MVLMRGYLDVLSPVGVCGAKHFRARSVQLVPSGDGSTRVVTERLDKDRVRINPQLPNNQQLIGLTRLLVRAVSSRNVQVMKEHTEPDLYKELVAQVRERASRLRFLVKNRQNLFGLAIAAREPSVDVLQAVDEADVAVACVCKKRSCDPTFARIDTAFQSFADPYYCVRTQFEDGKWYLVDQSLVASIAP